jgi:hypothetical protein
MPKLARIHGTAFHGSVRQDVMNCKPANLTPEIFTTAIFAFFTRQIFGPFSQVRCGKPARYSKPSAKAGAISSGGDPNLPGRDTD